MFRPRRAIQGIQEMARVIRPASSHVGRLHSTQDQSCRETTAGSKRSQPQPQPQPQSQPQS